MSYLAGGFVADRVVSFVALGLLVAACSAPIDRPPPANTNSESPPRTPIQDSGDGDDDSDAGDGGSGTNNGCKQATLQGSVVSQQSKSGAAPEPTGGTIAPGTYALTSADYYGGTAGTATGVQATFTLVVEDGSVIVVGMRVAGAVDQSKAEKAVQTLHFTTSGTQMFFTPVCPPTASFQTELDYSATDTQLTFYKNDFDLEIYTKQN